MGAVIGAALIGARLFRQDSHAALLAGGATAICGASAALALWSLIGDRRVDQARFTLTLVGITVASALAMTRSEEHTSELQSLMRISYAVFCLKKKTKITTNNNDINQRHHKST